MIPIQKSLTYLIRVRGQIPSQWLEAFSNLAIEKKNDAQGIVSQLSGVFDDGAALQGVLNNLYSLGLTLISVEAVNDGPSDELMG